MYTPSLTQQHTYFGVGSPCLSTKELLAHARLDPAGAESGMHSAPPWGIRATFVALLKRALLNLSFYIYF